MAERLHIIAVNSNSTGREEENILRHMTTADSQTLDVFCIAVRTLANLVGPNWEDYEIMTFSQSALKVLCKLGPEGQRALVELVRHRVNVGESAIIDIRRKGDRSIFSASITELVRHDEDGPRIFQLSLV